MAPNLTFTSLVERARIILTRFSPRKHHHVPEPSSDSNAEPYEPVPCDYPIFPSPAPEQILEAPDAFFKAVPARKFAAPQGVFKDNSLFALYRLYEFIILDKRFAYRSILEWFWRQHQWPVHNIPDPRDDNPLRLTALGGVTYLMVKSFNERIEKGLHGVTSPLVSMEEIERRRAEPESERPYDRVPDWAAAAPALAELLVIPTEEDERLQGPDDERADPDFLAKNILLWTPHISFT